MRDSTLTSAMAVTSLVFGMLIPRFRRRPDGTMPVNEFGRSAAKSQLGNADFRVF